MWSRNALTERLDLEWPILQAPMGSNSTPALAAAVSNAGGLGGLGMWGATPAEAERRIAGFRQLSGGAINANYPLWADPGDLTGTGEEMRERLRGLFDAAGVDEMPEPHSTAGEIDSDYLATLCRLKPEVISFHFALPPPDDLAALQAAGSYIIASATTVAEARELAARGVDAVIAQGAEAGGHRGTFSGVDMAQQPGLMSLLPQVVDAVAVPVIAAGGIADGRGIAAAMILGASAVQMGTAFLGAEEANVLPEHRDALRRADDASTIVSAVGSGRPARVIRNRLVDDLSPAEPLPFPSQLSVTKALAGTGDADFAILHSGQSAALTRDLPAADLVRALADETSRRLAAFR